MLNWATQEELQALADRIEANRIAQQEQIQAALEVILKRISDLHEDVVSKPKVEGTPAEKETHSTGGFTPFSARKREFERKNRKDLTTKTSA